MSKGKRYKFLGSTFQVVTGYAAPVSGITGISKANPAVVSEAGHGRATGDVVKLSDILGMVELNGAVCVVKVLTPDTFELLDVDSTNYDAYISGGTHALAEFSGSCEVTGYQGDSGTTTESETETNCGKAIDFGATDPGSVTLSYNHAPNAFQNAIQAARKSVAITVIKTTIAGAGGVMYDIGTITQVSRGAQSGGNWTGGCTLRRDTDRIDLAAA